MAIFTKGENKIGYKITVWSSTGKTTSHRGFSEGSPLLDTKIKSKLLDVLPTQALKTLLGGGLGVSAMMATAGFVGSSIGNTISVVLMNALNKTLLRKAELTFAQKETSIGVTLAGDFQASYKIESMDDLKALPGLLSIIPATFNVAQKPYWMGKSIIECLCNEQMGACIEGGNINIRYTVDV
ncbi:MAG: hypothetical protein R2747_22380 [Pyrinomonadaceae bacterium]